MEKKTDYQPFIRDEYNADGEALSYALSKQIPSMYAIFSNYGQFNLDDEMKEAIQKVLSKIVKKRLAKFEKERK